MPNFPHIDHGAVAQAGAEECSASVVASMNIGKMPERKKMRQHYDETRFPSFEWNTADKPLCVIDDILIVLFALFNIVRVLIWIELIGTQSSFVEGPATKPASAARWPHTWHFKIGMS